MDKAWECLAAFDAGQIEQLSQNAMMLSCCCVDRLLGSSSRFQKLYAWLLPWLQKRGQHEQLHVFGRGMSTVQCLTENKQLPALLGYFCLQKLVINCGSCMSKCITMCDRDQRWAGLCTNPDRILEICWSGTCPDPAGRATAMEGLLGLCLDRDLLVAGCKRGRNVR